MKTPYYPLLALLFLFTISCKNSEQEIVPTPNPPGNGGETPVQKFTLSIKPSSVPAASAFTAVISVQKEDGSALYTDANLALTLVDGKLVSTGIDLTAGKYKLTKLLIKDNKQTVIVAAPLLNSAKATGTINALPFEFTEAPATIESASVNETDLPEEFGYESTAFGETPFIKTKIKSVIYIAGVAFRPATEITITSGAWTKKVQNNSEVLLPKKFDGFHFESNTWTLPSNKTVSTAELRLNPSVTLESSSTPKLIKEQLVSLPAAIGGSVIDSKTQYFYLASGQLSKTVYHQRNQEGVLTMQATHEFNYSNGRLILINHTNWKDENFGYTLFSYDALGRIASIEDKSYDTRITASFDYPSDKKVEAHYLFNNGNTMSYTMTYFESNKVEDLAFGGGSEAGKYTYDDKVNPFHFINYPDLYLSNTSKNNKLNEEKSYGGNIPSLELYKTEYSYDEQGYPELVIKSYRGFTSKQHLFKSVTEYSYY